MPSAADEWIAFTKSILKAIVILYNDGIRNGFASLHLNKFINVDSSTDLLLIFHTKQPFYSSLQLWNIMHVKLL